MASAASANGKVLSTTGVNLPAAIIPASVSRSSPRSLETKARMRWPMNGDRNDAQRFRSIPHLAAARLRGVDVVEAEHLGRAVGVPHDGLHDGAPSLVGRVGRLTVGATSRA